MKRTPSSLDRTDPNVLAALPGEPHREFLRQMESLLALASHLNHPPSTGASEQTEPDRLLQGFYAFQEQIQGLGLGHLNIDAETLHRELKESLSTADFAGYRRGLQHRVLTAIETNRLYLDQLTLWSRVLQSVSTKDPRTQRYDASGSLVTQG